MRLIGSPEEVLPFSTGTFPAPLDYNEPSLRKSLLTQAFFQAILVISSGFIDRGESLGCGWEL